MKAGFTARMAARRASGSAGSSGEPPAPARGPGVIGAGVREQRAYGRVPLRTRRRVAQPAERQGEVGAVLRHALQQILGQRDVVLALGGEADLAPQPAEIGRLEARAERPPAPPSPPPRA